MTSEKDIAHLRHLNAFANTFTENDEFAEHVLQNLQRRCAYGHDKLPVDKTGRVDQLQFAYLTGARDLVSYILRTVEEARAIENQE